MAPEEIIKTHCFESNGYLNITPRGAYELCLTGAVLLDVREEYHSVYKKFNVKEVIYCPLSVIDEKLSDFPTDRKLIVADASGLRSREAMTLLIKKGFDNLINLAGGMVEWERDGMSLAEDLEQKLTGSCMCQLKPRTKK